MLKTDSEDLEAAMQDIGRRARQAARVLANAPGARKKRALEAMAAAIHRHKAEILAANAIDLAEMKKNGVNDAFLDRGTLTEKRIVAMADALTDIAALADPVGRVLARWTRPNGLTIERVATPLGVIGIIYESRPNVTADAGGLCLMAGNAAILRCGSDSYASSSAILLALQDGLAGAGLPTDAIQLVPSRDRAAVGHMLSGLGGQIDVIVPRGGKSLVARVQAEARVPVFAHLEGICHLYIHRAADLDMAVRLAVNAKMRRTGVCGAAETLLMDRAAAATHLKPVLDALSATGCEIRATAEVQDLWKNAKLAVEVDWSTEYLDAILSVKLVDGLDEAIDHIERYGSHHTESIVTADLEAARRFLQRIDSAIVMHNASTQFADGGEFGMGAEIGIATGKMHARGPVGVEQLTSFKYCVHGTGQTRP